MCAHSGVAARKAAKCAFARAYLQTHAEPHEKRGSERLQMWGNRAKSSEMRSPGLLRMPRDASPTEIGRSALLGVLRTLRDVSPKNADKFAKL